MNARYDCFCKLSDLLGAQESLSEARRHLHRFPELSFQEKSTAQWVADRLEGWGYQVTRHVGGHGLVATLNNGEGKAIALRADMDALPIQEETQKPYASEHAGTMHACGHDGHTAMLLGAAQQLAKTKNFKGTVHLVFQPAEEAGKDSGAQQMIADGLFERFPCDAIFGIHNHPGVEVGTFMFGAGAFMTIGTAHAGSVSNVIPDTASLSMSIRSFSPEVRERLEQRIKDLVTAQVASFGGEVEIIYERGYPVVINSVAETEFARQVAVELVGEDKVVSPFGPVTGSEDFAYYLQHKPGCFLRLGNGTDSALLHNPKYDFNDQNLSYGAAYWTRLVERFLDAA
ncbi:MAG: amidohydrolase [Betaproteobacteria bacterium]|nr:amidohydrolase [Betaproteobacteria bacterium]